MYFAALELSVNVKSADFAIQRFCTLIRALPGSKRDLWRHASRRDFSIGVQVGDRPFSFDLALSVDTVQTASAVGSRIVFPAYSPSIMKAQSVPDDAALKRRAD